MGRWLDDSDFLFRGEDHEHDEPSEIGRHSFPRDWPDVYEESEVLRSMLKKKGPCAAKRVSVVPNIGDEHKSRVAGLELRWLQSLSNAEAVKKKAGLAVVEGWAIYDLLDDVTGAAFAAERYWWNTTADGTWLDFSPRAENVQQLLLVEALSPQPPKRPCTLTRKHYQLAEHLLEMRCPRARAMADRATRGAGPRASDAAVVAPLMGTEELKTAVKRVKLGISEPLQQLARRVEHDDRLCEGLVQCGMCGALAGQLLSQKHGAVAVQVLGALASAAVRGGFHKRAAESLLAADGVEALVELLQAREPGTAAVACLALGHSCFRCPAAQERAARKGAVRLLVRLLGRGPQPGAAEAAYALWHLQVACARNGTSALAEGAGPVLLALLRDEASEDGLRSKAAGALMPLAAVPGAQDELGAAGSVTTLCSLVSGAQSPEVACHAAGALMNLLSGHEDNCKQAACAGIVGPLVSTIRDGAGVAREYAAGALANLVARGGPGVGPAAVAIGAFDALGGLLSACDSNLEVFATLANLARHLPEDRSAMFESGVIERMVVSIVDEEDPARCQALALCMNLSPHVPAKARILKAGAVKPLVALLESNEEDMRERAAGALANLMDGHAETTANVFMEVPDLAKKLVYVLETEYSASIQRQMARAVALLASRRAEPVRKAGGTEPVAALLEELEEELAWEPALGLMNLAPVGKEREELVARGTLARLVRLLESPEARGYAAGALANLTAGCRGAAEAAIAAGAVPLLATLLTEADADGAVYAEGTSPHVRDTLEWAAGCLGTLAEYGGGGVQAQIVEGGAREPLVRLLTRGRGVGQELALFALSALKSPGEAELRGLLLDAAEPLQDLISRLYEGPLRDRALSLQRLAS